MNKHKLIIIIGPLVALAVVLAGCGGGGSDSSAAAPAGAPAMPPGVEAPAPGTPGAMAGAPAAPPGVEPMPGGAPGMPPGAPAGAPAAPAAPTAAPAGAPSGSPTDTAVAGTAEEKVPLESVIPAKKMRIVSEKQFDGTVLKYMVFSFKHGEEDPVTVELPIEFKNDRMSKSDWANMFMDYAAPVEVSNPDQEAASIRAQLGMNSR